MVDKQTVDIVSHDLDAVSVAEYFLALDAASPEPDVTQLKLQKLMYLAQANYLASTGLRLIDANTEAFENGPVIVQVWRAFAEFGKRIIAPERNHSNAPVLPPDAKAFLDEIWQRYQDWSASRLWRLSHDQPPWQDHYQQGQLHVVIPDHSIVEYFRTKVPLNERVFHPGVVVIDEATAAALDANEDRKVAEALAALV